MNQFNTAATILSMLLSMPWIACHSSGESGLVEETRRGPSLTERASEPVDRFEAELGERVRARVARVPQAHLETALADHPTVDRFAPPIPELVRALYAERDYQPVFVVDGELTGDGALLLETLRNAWDHTLVPQDYAVDVVVRASRHLERAGSVLEDMRRVALLDEQRRALVEFLASRPDLLDLEPSALQDELTTLVLDPPEGEDSPLPRLHEAYQRYAEAAVATRSSAIDAELALAAGFLRYAWDMRFFNSAWFERDLREDEQLLDAARRDALMGAFRAGVEAGFEPVLATLPPHYQQYGRLLEAHRRYLEIVANGGWNTDIVERELELGHEYDVVPRLRQRLQAEGYFDGDLTSREYDRDIRAAYHHYQLTHQFRDDGNISGQEAASLNVSALDRARQIAISLRRWRENQTGNETYYLQVNIADFHVEVWRDGHRDMRFPIVVGATNRVRRRDGRVDYLRATPELDEDMRFLVFNPYWNVPPGIMINEYDPNLEEDPFWYENNGFEVLYNENGQRWVRQLPGPDNALGRVKFLFPNEYDVYMHDTPLRHLFRRSVRAFSHGCMRLSQPMELAYYILENDRGWTPERVDEVRAGGTEQWVTLRTPIPVHVDTMVARVDDDGVANFGADLYDRDRPYLAAVIADETRAVVGDAGLSIGAGVDLAAARSTTYRAELAHAETAASESGSQGSAASTD